MTWGPPELILDPGPGEMAGRYWPKGHPLGYIEALNCLDFLEKSGTYSAEKAADYRRILHANLRRAIEEGGGLDRAAS